MARPRLASRECDDTIVHTRPYPSITPDEHVGRSHCGCCQLWSAVAGCVAGGPNSKSTGGNPARVRLSPRALTAIERLRGSQVVTQSTLAGMFCACTAPIRGSRRDARGEAVSTLLPVFDEGKHQRHRLARAAAGASSIKRIGI